MQGNGRWQRLYDDLAGRIRRGELPPGAKLPSIQELCAAHEVSHITVRSALARLLADGLATSRPGAGYYSAGPRPAVAAPPQVAMVLPGPDAFFLDMIHGAEELLHRRGHRLVVAVANHDGAVLAERMRALLGSVAGFIVSPGRGGHDYRAWVPVLEHGTPFAFIDHWIPGLAAPIITTDNRAGGEEITAHLLARGRRRIWVLAERGFSSVEERIAGHHQALAAAGIAADPSLVLRSELIGGPARDEFARLLPPQLAVGDAVFASNELMAQAAYQAVRARGWRPGEEVAVAGYDDVIAAHFDPPLTTMAQDLRGLGSAAAAALLARIADPAAPPPPPLRLPPRLVVRESCGRAREVA